MLFGVSYMHVFCVCTCSTHLSVFNKERHCRNRGFPTRMVYLYYISCLRYTILVGNPRSAVIIIVSIKTTNVETTPSTTWFTLQATLSHLVKHTLHFTQSCNSVTIKVSSLFPGEVNVSELPAVCQQVGPTTFCQLPSEQKHHQ